MKIKRPILFLILIGATVYFNSLFNGFVWDDEEQILNNLPIHSLGNIFQFFSQSTFNGGGTGTLGGLYYKPLMTTFFSLIYTIFGPNAFFFHLFQVSLHIISSVFIFKIFCRFFKSATWPFFLAAIFLVHPINTETVVYISDLQDILFLFFGLWALHSVSMIKIFLLLLASILSKETGILFFPIIGLYTLLFIRKKFWAYLVSASAALGVYLILRFAIAGIFFNKHGLSPITVMPFSERILSIPKIIFSYLKTFVYPDALAINQHWAVKSLSWNEFTLPLIIDLLIFIILLGFTLYLYKRKMEDFKSYFFFLGWFLTGLGLHLQIFPLDLTYSDRWFYFPIIGLLGMIGISLKEIKIENIIKIIMMITIISLSFRTFIRNFDWKDGLTLYGHDIKISQNSFDLENNYGVELFRHNRMEEAVIHFEKSAQLAPKWWTNWNNLGVVYERKEDYAKAKEYYKKAIDNGEYYLAYENYASILIFKDSNPKEAKEFAQESLKKLPLNSKLWLILSIADYKLGNKEEALLASRQAYILSPSEQTAYVYSRLSQNQPLE